MATTEEILKFSFVADTQQLDQGAKSVEGMGKAARSAGEAFIDAAGRLRDARGRFVEMGQAAEHADPKVRELASQLAAAGRAGDSIAGGADKAKKSTADLGRAALEGGRILQDFVQGGVGGIINNLEGAARALGGGAGLAGLLTGVGVAAFLAKPYIAAFLESLSPEKFDPTKSALERLRDRIKEINDLPIKTAADRAEVNALERDVKRATTALEAYNEAKGLKSKAERESESATKEALAESGVDVAGVLRKDILGDPDANPAVATLRKQLDEATRRRDQQWEAVKEGIPGATHQMGILEDRVKALDEQLRTTRADVIAKAEGRIGDLYGNATGKGAPGQVGEGNEALAKALEHAGRGDLARDIRQTSPRALKANEESNAEMDRQQEEIQGGGKELTRQLGQARQKRKGTTDELAQALDRWATREILEAGELTAERVKAALENAQAESGDDTVAAVMAKLRESYGRKVRDKALNLGGADVETAQDALLGDLNASGDKADARLEDRFEAWQEKQAREHQAAVDRAGSHAATTYGGGLREQVELALNRNRMARNPEDEQSLRMRLGAQVNMALRGAVGADGLPLSMEERGNAAHRIVNGAMEDLGKRTVALQARNLDATQVGMAIDAQLMQAVEAQGAKLDQLQQQQAAMLQRARGIAGTALRRGR